MKKFLFSFLCLLLISTALHAQPKKRKAYNINSNNGNPFLRQQWWIGLKGGINMTKINVEKSFSIIEPTNYQSTLAKKNYEKFKPIGTQIGLEATYFFNGFSASVQPLYQNIKFSYSNSFSWIDPETSNSLNLSYHQAQQVSYFIVPLIFKYEFTVNRISPYVQLGAYFGYLLNANKSVEMSGTDFASGGENPIQFEPVLVGATDLFAKKHYGFVGGAGLYYNIGNIRLNLDLQYKLGRSIINSAENRYQNDRLSGIGDAMDDITADNISVSLGTLFPLRFLSSGFKSFDK